MSELESKGIEGLKEYLDPGSQFYYYQTGEEISAATIHIKHNHMHFNFSPAFLRNMFVPGFF